MERTEGAIKDRASMKIAALPDDGIGTEIVAEAVKVLNAGPKVGDGNHSG